MPTECSVYLLKNKSPFYTENTHTHTHTVSYTTSLASCSIQTEYWNLMSNPENVITNILFIPREKADSIAFSNFHAPSSPSVLRCLK